MIRKRQAAGWLLPVLRSKPADVVYSLFISYPHGVSPGDFLKIQPKLPQWKVPRVILTVTTWELKPKWQICYSGKGTLMNLLQSSHHLGLPWCHKFQVHCLHWGPEHCVKPAHLEWCRAHPGQDRLRADWTHAFPQVLGSSMGRVLQTHIWSHQGSHQDRHLHEGVSYSDPTASKHPCAAKTAHGWCLWERCPIHNLQVTKIVPPPD